MNRPFAGALRVAGLLVLGLLANPAWADVVTYFHNDLSGTPMAATDANGNLLWKETYRPYGERLLNAASPNTNRLWYGGKPEDATTGLSYFGARYYNSQIGRFMGVDPKEVDPNDLYSFNRYAYANNNPYKFVDPDVRAVETAWDALNIGLGVSSLISNLKAGSYSLAAVDAVGVIVDSIAAAIPLVPGGVGSIIKVTREGAEITAKVAAKGVGTAAKSSGEVIQVTKGGVALPPGAKHQIPEGYVQNPHRSGSYGEVVDGKFKERLRIDPPTPPRQKGPNYSHYHRDGKGTHYSPRPGDKDPGFGP